MDGKQRSVGVRCCAQRMQKETKSTDQPPGERDWRYVEEAWMDG